MIDPTRCRSGAEARCSHDCSDSAARALGWLGMPCTIMAGTHNRLTPLLGTTPIEESSTWIVIAACREALTLAGHLDWAWDPKPQPSCFRTRLDTRCQLREWRFGLRKELASASASQASSVARPVSS